MTESRLRGAPMQQHLQEDHTRHMYNSRLQDWHLQSMLLGIKQLLLLAGCLAKALHSAQQGASGCGSVASDDQQRRMQTLCSALALATPACDPLRSVLSHHRLLLLN